MNDCAGEGGCGEHPGENECKGRGECAVPLSDKPWAKARKNFEAAMTKAGKKFGDAPRRKAESPSVDPERGTSPRLVRGLGRRGSTMSWHRYGIGRLMGIAAVGFFLVPGPVLGGPSHRSPPPKVSPTASPTVSSIAVLRSRLSTTTVVINFTPGRAGPQATSQYVSIRGPDGTMKTFRLGRGTPVIQIRLAAVQGGAAAQGH
jgi:hypothetical protein